MRNQLIFSLRLFFVTLFVFSSQQSTTENYNEVICTKPRLPSVQIIAFPIVSVMEPDSVAITFCVKVSRESLTISTIRQDRIPHPIQTIATPQRLIKQITHPITQLFYFEHYLNGWYVIKSKESGFVLQAGSVNQYLLPSKLTYAKNQLWKLRSIIPLDRDVYIISGLNDKTLEVLGDTKNNDQDVVIGTRRNVNSQIWKLKRTIEGFYRIKNMNSKKFLTVENASLDSGAPLVQNDWIGGQNQQFSFKYVENDCFSIKVRNSNLFLDFVGNSTKDGSQIVQYTETRKLTQSFYFKAPLNLDDSVMFNNYQIENSLMALSL